MAMRRIPYRDVNKKKGSKLSGGLLDTGRCFRILFAFCKAPHPRKPWRKPGPHPCCKLHPVRAAVLGTGRPRCIAPRL